MIADCGMKKNGRIHLWLIHLIGVIVPRRLRADWRQEWEAELRCRKTLPARKDNFSWKQEKFDPGRPGLL